ncbi:MAG: carboxylate--amine ligase [Alphaproteobacteria bacterium]
MTIPIPLEAHLPDEWEDAPVEEKTIAVVATVPVLILGGKENSLSLVRNLGRHGVTVRVSGRDNTWGLYSRYCTERFLIPRGQSAEAFWRALLLDPDSRQLDGHIVLACSDEAIEFVSTNREQLDARYRLTEETTKLQSALLDKRRTLELAQAVGVATPNFWSVDSSTDLQRLRSQIQFPVIVKPILSHQFIRVFGRKLFIVERGFDELEEKLRLCRQHDLEVMIVEMIPGPDDLLSSYYTYIDMERLTLFKFTKRIIRRFPLNRGGAYSHATEWLPETAAQGLKFFEGIGFTGLGNVEFKRDPRDGKLKIIECNARFTAAQELLVQCGAPIDLIIYHHLTGQRTPKFTRYRENVLYWYPFRDFLAFLQLRRLGRLSFRGWIRSLRGFRQIVFPLWNRRDVRPLVGVALANARRLLRGRA